MGLKAYQRKYRLAEQMGVSVHQVGQRSEYEQNLSKLTVKNSWIKVRDSDDDNQEGLSRETFKPTSAQHRKNARMDPSSCLFIPRTPHGALAKTMRDVEERLQKSGLNKVRIKMVAEIQVNANSVKKMESLLNIWGKVPEVYTNAAVNTSVIFTAGKIAVICWTTY